MLFFSLCSCCSWNRSKDFLKAEQSYCMLPIFCKCRYYTKHFPPLEFQYLCFAFSAFRPQRLSRFSENGYCNNNISRHNDNRVQENACIATKHHLGVTASYIFVMSPAAHPEPPGRNRRRAGRNEGVADERRNEKANTSADLMLTWLHNAKASKLTVFF